MKAPFIPDLGIVYPEKPDARMVELIEVREINVDENYPFFDKSFKFRIINFFLYLGIFTVAFLVCFLLHGIKIEGRKNLWKHRKILKDGAMTVSNHMHRWDFIFVTLAVRYRRMFFPAFKDNLKGPDAGWIKHAGGIPVPDDIRAMKAFNSAFDEIHKKKIWIHAFPESTRFNYFTPVRPFKKGVFTMAHRYNLPVIPVAMSYRKAGFPFTLLNKHRVRKGGKELPLITIRIGEPLLFDKNLGRRESVQKIRKECHEAVVRLAGITGNPYPAEGD